MSGRHARYGYGGLRRTAGPPLVLLLAVVMAVAWARVVTPDDRDLTYAGSPGQQLLWAVGLLLITGAVALAVRRLRSSGGRGYQSGRHRP